MNTRFVLVALTAALACPAMSSAADDPWSLVPAWPTACYSSEDQWADTLAAAVDTVNQTMYQQQEVNAAIDQQVSGSLNDDPMAMAQRVQQAMMADPANAQKMLQQMMQQAQPEETQAELFAQHEKEVQFETESKAVAQEYRTSLAQAMEPADTRERALHQKLDLGNAPEPGWPSWAVAEWREIQKQRDSAYVSNCARWWATKGPIHSYLERYRRYLVDERIPYEQKVKDEPALQQYQMLDATTDGWRTTTDYEATVDYMNRASELFGLRDNAPRCASATCI